MGKKHKTVNQQQFYDSIIPKRRYVKKQKPPTEPQITTDEQYVKNCFYWLQSYFTGDCDKERFNQTIQAIIEHAKKHNHY